MMLSEMERRAWDSRAGSEQHKPEMACKVVIDDIENGLNAKHVIVVVVEDIGVGEVIHLYQSGGLSELTVEGALNRAILTQATKER